MHTKKCVGIKFSCKLWDTKLKVYKHAGILFFLFIMINLSVTTFSDTNNQDKTINQVSVSSYNRSYDILYPISYKMILMMLNQNALTVVCMISN